VGTISSILDCLIRFKASQSSDIAMFSHNCISFWLSLFKKSIHAADKSFWFELKESSTSS
jgi:hypothetical protein